MKLERQITIMTIQYRGTSQSPACGLQRRYCPSKKLMYTFVATLFQCNALGQGIGKALQPYPLTAKGLRTGEEDVIIEKDLIPRIELARSTILNTITAHGNNAFKVRDFQGFHTVVYTVSQPQARGDHLEIMIGDLLFQMLTSYLVVIFLNKDTPIPLFLNRPS